jgi:hypothetical protein
MAKINDKNGIVYVLTNPAMPGFVKVGGTTRDELKRMKELYKTGVPVPFNCAYVCKVKGHYKPVEDRFKKVFKSNRPNPEREFYEIEPEQAIAFLEEYHIEEECGDLAKKIEKKVNKKMTKEESKSEERLGKNRPKMNFYELRIPSDAILQYKYDRRITVTVCGEKTVLYKKKETYLHPLTKELLGYSAQPSPYWLYKGKTLLEIYKNFHNKKK